MRSGGRACECADALQCFDEIVEERVAGREAQEEPAAGAADGGGDGDEAEAEPFCVAGALLLEQVEGEQRAEQVGPVGVEAFTGQVVEAEPKLRFLDLVFEVGLRAVPALELVGAAFTVVADEHPVVPLASFEAELLAGLDGVAADDEAPLLSPGLGPPAEARDLAASPVARRLPVGRRDLADPAAYRGDQGRPNRVGDLLALQLGEEVLAPEALVGTQKQPGAVG